MDFMNKVNAFAKANIEEKKAALNSGKEKTDHTEDPFEQM